MKRKGKSPCIGCGAECCKYIALTIPEPAATDDYDAIIWYLHHSGVCVYVDCDSDWYVQVDTLCKHTTPNGRCRIYDSRSKICRDYAPENCERGDPLGDNIVEFYSAQEFVEFFHLNFKAVGEKVRRKSPKYITARTPPATSEEGTPPVGAPSGKSPRKRVLRGSARR